MRLLNTTEPHHPKLESFVDCQNAPRYAILSHTWGNDEVTYRDIQRLDDRVRSTSGYRKIRGTCDLARRRGFEYVWLDTCCIDKTSSAELSEAINSMYQWYHLAEVCFVYLSDSFSDAQGSQDQRKALQPSRWFFRGWTLQELLAPPEVEFYTQKWAFIGSKHDLRLEISAITGIPIRVLEGASLKRFGVAEKMSWASRRRTTRLEDAAYCLLGLFGINMPLLYGEGSRAFARLQEEILCRTQDHTLFTPNLRLRHRLWHQSPSVFESHTVPFQGPWIKPSEITSKGVRLELPAYKRTDCYFFALDCKSGHDNENKELQDRQVWMKVNKHSYEEIPSNEPQTSVLVRAYQLTCAAPAALKECALTVLYIGIMPDLPQSRVGETVQILIDAELPDYHFVTGLPRHVWDVTGPRKRIFWTSSRSINRVKTTAETVGQTFCCLIFEHSTRKGSFISLLASFSDLAAFFTLHRLDQDDLNGVLNPIRFRGYMQGYQDRMRNSAWIGSLSLLDRVEHLSADDSIFSVKVLSRASCEKGEFVCKLTQLEVASDHQAPSIREPAGEGG